MQEVRDGNKRSSSRWDWHEKGVVLFLGGDQLNTVLAGLRLNYSTAAYCNEAVRCNGLINWIALRSENLKCKCFNFAHRPYCAVLLLFTHSLTHSLTLNTKT